jgi:hypothetical protein
MDMTDADGIETRMYQWPQPSGYDYKSEYYPEFPVCLGMDYITGYFTGKSAASEKG